MEAGYRYDDARASNQARDEGMIVYLVVTSLILEMDFMEMFDMLRGRLGNENGMSQLEYFLNR